MLRAVTTYINILCLCIYGRGTLAASLAPPHSSPSRQAAPPRHPALPAASPTPTPPNPSAARITVNYRPPLAVLAFPLRVRVCLRLEAACAVCPVPKTSERRHGLPFEEELDAVVAAALEPPEPDAPLPPPGEGRDAEPERPAGLLHR